MIQKSEKGFAMVLSLVLLLAMSLMGGALILISSGDHESNNNNDKYQQTFYAAEMALLEGERYLLNEKSGPWDEKTNARDDTKKNLPDNPEKIAANKFDGKMVRQVNYKKKDKYKYPITKTKNLDKAFMDTSDTCFKSFANIDRDNFYVIKKTVGAKDEGVARSYNLGVFLEKSFKFKGIADERIEAARLKEYYYEYFIERIGAASFKGFGQSIKKTASDASKNGIAYRVYGCGIYGGKDLKVVSLESVVVLPQN